MTTVSTTATASTQLETEYIVTLHTPASPPRWREAMVIQAR